MARPDPDVTVARISGRNLVFSTTLQRVFELNDTAAAIWQSLSEGALPSDVARHLAACGATPEESKRYVDEMLCAWGRLGIRPASVHLPRSDSDGRPFDAVLQIAGMTIGLRLDIPEARRALEPFRHLAAARRAENTDVDVTFDVTTAGNEHHIFRNSHWTEACNGADPATVLKARLMTEILEAGQHALALHAAALLRNNRMLLLCGAPGSGKSTLALGLVGSGFAFAGDDLATVEGDGKIRGVAFPAAVKQGAWPLVARYHPQVARSPVQRRPDGRRVRYVVPDATREHKPAPLGWIVLLRRQRTAHRASLHAVDISEALDGLLAGATSPSRRLTTRGFHALVEATRTATYSRLVYSDLDDAVRTLLRACR